MLSYDVACFYRTSGNTIFCQNMILITAKTSGWQHCSMFMMFYLTLLITNACYRAHSVSIRHVLLFFTYNISVGIPLQTFLIQLEDFNCTLKLLLTLRQYSLIQYKCITLFSLASLVFSKHLQWGCFRRLFFASNLSWSSSWGISTEAKVWPAPAENVFEKTKGPWEKNCMLFSWVRLLLKS